MREITITEAEAGQRLDKVLGKILDNTGRGFLYKMLRKKNIKLNNKKAFGHEKLQPGDRIQLYFADASLEKLSGTGKEQQRELPAYALDILYEDENIILINKPVGMLSQKAKAEDISVNEYLVEYIRQKGTGVSLVRPSVCNRLDRNTSGLLIGGCSMAGLQTMAELLKKRKIHKYYLTVVKGCMKENQTLEGYLKKNEANNTVTFYPEATEGASRILTKYKVMSSNERYSLLKVELITGKTHQIRAHLASMGHPVIGDQKYGDRELNRQILQEYGCRHQLLHAFAIKFEEVEGKLHYLSGQIFQAPLPEQFQRIVEKEHL